MSDTPTAVAINAAPAPARWSNHLPLLLSVMSTLVMLGGFMLTIGAWRATVDQQIATLDKRVTKTEANQERYIPVLVGMTKDLSYLADRARREDERRDRAAIH